MFRETASPTRLYLSLKPYGAASKQPLRLSASSTRLWYYLKPYIAACKQLWRETASPSRPSLWAWDWLQSSWPPSTNTPLTAMLTGIHNKFLNRSNRLKKGLSDWFLTLIHHENLFRYLKYQHNLTRSLSQTKKSYWRRKQACFQGCTQTLSDATPPTVKIHPFSKPPYFWTSNAILMPFSLFYD